MKQTHDLANGLPWSNQLSYRVIRQLSGRVRVKAELQGTSQSGYQAGMFDGEGATSMNLLQSNSLLLYIHDTEQTICDRDKITVNPS